MIPGDHIFGIGFQHTGIGSRLGEDFADHFQIMAQGFRQSETFRKPGGVDVRGHIYQGLNFCCLAGTTFDKSQLYADPPAIVDSTRASESPETIR